jgi:hypothetical protein
MKQYKLQAVQLENEMEETKAEEEKETKGKERNIAHEFTLS